MGRGLGVFDIRFLRVVVVKREFWIKIWNVFFTFKVIVYLFFEGFVIRRRVILEARGFRGILRSLEGFFFWSCGEV